ncbi:MAG: hypothetical protein ACREVT_12845 [Burkholderiales bacterium]
MSVRNEDSQVHSAKRGSDQTSAIRVGVWFAGIGGLAIPLALWVVMTSSISLLGAEVGLRVSVLAETFLTMAWPTSIVFIAPGLGVGVITVLLVVNVIAWGLIGFISEKIILRPAPYYGVLAILVLGLFISNGSFIWIAIDSSKVALDLINIPTFGVAVIVVTAIFILRRRRALSRLH